MKHQCLATKTENANDLYAYTHCSIRDLVKTALTRIAHRPTANCIVIIDEKQYVTFSCGGTSYHVSYKLYRKLSILPIISVIIMAVAALDDSGLAASAKGNGNAC